MADLARQIPDVLRLEAGDPNFYISSHGIEAAARAGHDGFTKYTPSGGFSTLRQLVADKVRDRNGFESSKEMPYSEDAGGCKIFLSSETHSSRASLSIP